MPKCQSCDSAQYTKKNPLFNVCGMSEIYLLQINKKNFNAQYSSSNSSLDVAKYHIRV